MKKILTTLLLTILIVSLTACSGTVSADSSTQTQNTVLDLTTPGTTSQATVTTPVSADFDDDDFASATNGAAIGITLNGDSIAVAGEGATANGSTVTITAAGTYEVSGTLNNGQIIVDTQDAENVTLLLAGVSIHNESGPPIYVANAEKVVLTLVEGTQSNLSDGASYTNLDESGEPNAALFSHDDLTINGTGALNVNANYYNGITSKDDLKITGGTIMVNAVNDGIKGRDSLVVKDGLITVNASADGLQANNDEDPEKGYIIIEGGAINITAGLDGIQAETNLLVSGGTLDIVTGGGSVSSASDGGFTNPGSRDDRVEGNSNQTEDSIKGLKAKVDLTISGGEITISALDDALHSNSTLTINRGVIEVTSGDDGVHADDTLTINGGILNIIQSYEGLESQIITLNDGTIHLIASDDGINATDGGGGGMSGPGVEYGDNYVYINGGYLYMNSGGDGLDSNGNFAMTGGVVLVDGPTTDFEGPLDYGTSFKVTGGFLVAVGSSGMAQAPSADSTQYSVLYNFDNMQAAGTLLYIQSQSGQEILTFMPTKEYQSVMISSAALQNGETYLVYTSGSSTGAITDGLYEGGVYTPGVQVASFTISSMVTSNGMMGGGPGGGRPGGGPGGDPGGAPPTRP